MVWHKGMGRAFESRCSTWMLGEKTWLTQESRSRESEWLFALLNKGRPEWHWPHPLTKHCGLFKIKEKKGLPAPVLASVTAMSTCPR